LNTARRVFITFMVASGSCLSTKAARFGGISGALAWLAGALALLERRGSADASFWRFLFSKSFGASCFGS
jgi:hypothetical protein